MRLYLLLACVAGVTASGACKTEVGLVSGDPVGVWFDQLTRERVTANYSVCADSVIVRLQTPGRDAANDRIVIRPRRGKTPKPFICRELQDCARPLDLSRLISNEQNALQGSDWVKSFFTFLMTYRSAISHSADAGDRARFLRPAVVTANQTFDVSEIFVKRVPLKTYYLDVCPHATDSACRSTDTNTNEVDLTQPLVRAPFRLKPGVYVLYRLHGAGKPRTEDHAVVVAADAKALKAKGNDVLVKQGRDFLRRTAVAALSAVDDMEASQLDAYMSYVADELSRRLN
jgi:hypothetical protein